mgnify:FL=1
MRMQPADRGLFLGAIYAFQETGERPDLDSMPDVVAVTLEAIWPTLENSRAKSLAGRKGGSCTDEKPGDCKAEASAKQTASKTEAEAKQTPSKREAEAKQTPSEEEEEEELERDKVKTVKGGARRARFTPPTADEVEAYAGEAGIQLDAGAFCDFYAAKGWKVGSSPMRDWRAAARNWARRDRDGPSGRRRGSSEGVSGRAPDWIGDYA